MQRIGEKVIIGVFAGCLDGFLVIISLKTFEESVEKKLALYEYEPQDFEEKKELSELTGNENWYDFF
jgi:hypothetical protein